MWWTSVQVSCGGGVEGGDGVLATSTITSTTTTTITMPMSAATAPIPLMVDLAFRMDLTGARMGLWCLRVKQSRLAKATATRRPYHLDLFESWTAAWISSEQRF